MDSQVDGVFHKMVSLLRLMKETGQTDPSNPKIGIELQKYERELYLNLRDYGSLLRRYLHLDKAAAEEAMAKDIEMARLRRELEDDDFDLSWDAGSEERLPTMEMAPPPTQAQPARSSQETIPSISTAPTGTPARPMPPRASAEDRPGVRPRSASEILSQLHGSAEG